MVLVDGRATHGDPVCAGDNSSVEAVATHLDLYAPISSLCPRPFSSPPRIDDREERKALSTLCNRLRDEVQRLRRAKGYGEKLRRNQRVARGRQGGGPTTPGFSGDAKGPAKLLLSHLVHSSTLSRLHQQHGKSCAGNAHDNDISTAQFWPFRTCGRLPSPSDPQSSQSESLVKLTYYQANSLTSFATLQ